MPSLLNYPSSPSLSHVPIFLSVKLRFPFKEATFLHILSAALKDINPAYLILTFNCCTKFFVLLGRPSSSNIFWQGGGLGDPVPSWVPSATSDGPSLLLMAPPFLPHLLMLSPHSSDSFLLSLNLLSGRSFLVPMLQWLPNVGEPQIYLQLRPFLNSRFTSPTAYSPSLRCPIRISNLICLK